MEIQVKIVNLLPMQSFTSSKTGNSYNKYTFVGETAGQYPKKIAFTVMGDDKFSGMNIVVGGTYTVSFDVESREWQGRWFTEASAWKAVRIDGEQGQQQAPAQTSAPTQSAPQPQAPAAEKIEDLPF